MTRKFLKNYWYYPILFMSTLLIILMFWNLIHDYNLAFISIILAIGMFILTYFPKQNRYFRQHARRFLIFGVLYFIVILLESFRSFKLTKVDIFFANVIFFIFVVISIFLISDVIKLIKEWIHYERKKENRKNVRKGWYYYFNKAVIRCRT